MTLKVTIARSLPSMTVDLTAPAVAGLMSTRVDGTLDISLQSAALDVLGQAPDTFTVSNLGGAAVVVDMDLPAPLDFSALGDPGAIEQWKSEALGREVDAITPKIISMTGAAVTYAFDLTEMNVTLDQLSSLTVDGLMDLADRVEIDFGNGAARYEASGRTPVELDGGTGRQVFKGAGGDDEIDGGAGRDRLDGGRGADTLSGGNGNDRINGGAGTDEIDGGRGRDTIDGGRGKDVIDGDAGDDVLKGGAGNDVLRGGKGDDTIKGGKGRDTLIGGEGDDDLYGGRGADSFNFDADQFGSDTIHDLDRRDTILILADPEDVTVESFDALDPADAIIRLAGGTIVVENATVAEVEAAIFYL